MVQKKKKAIAPKASGLTKRRGRPRAFEPDVALSKAMDTFRDGGFAATSLDDLMTWCEERLAKAKRPRDITLVEELPRTSVGKIRKFLLRDPSAERSLSTSSASQR